MRLPGSIRVDTEPTLALICTIQDPITREPYRRVAILASGQREKVEAYLSEYRPRRYGVLRTGGGVLSSSMMFVTIIPPTALSIASIASEEYWNTGARRVPILGYKIRHKEGISGPAAGHSPGSAGTDVSRIREGWRSDRTAPPRSRHCRSGRNRHSFCCALKVMGD